MSREKRPQQEIDEEETRRCLQEFSETNRELTSMMGEMIKEIKENTNHSIKLKTEVRKQREVDEKNIVFLQSLVKDFLVSQKVENKNKWGMVKDILRWVLWITAVILLAALGIKVYSADIPLIG